MKPFDIFVTVVVGILMFLGGSAVTRLSNSKPRIYTVKTQDESYSGLRYQDSSNGRVEFLDKDNKKHVFSGNFRYVEE